MKGVDRYFSNYKNVSIFYIEEVNVSTSTNNRGEIFLGKRRKYIIQET